MRHKNNDLLQRSSDRNFPFFDFRVFRIVIRQSKRIMKNRGRLFKGHAMFFEIRPRFRRIPLIDHRLSLTQLGRVSYRFILRLHDFQKRMCRVA